MPVTVAKTAPKPRADAVTLTIPVRENAPKSKRSHYRKLQCPLCTSEVFDLKRHLKSHVKKDSPLKHKINKVYSVTMFQNGQRGPARSGLPYKWCPFQGSDLATHRLKSHLTHFHCLKPGALLEAYLKVAKRYQGKHEKEDLQDLLDPSDSEDDTTRPPACKVSASTSATESTIPPPAALTHVQTAWMMRNFRTTSSKRSSSHARRRPQNYINGWSASTNS